MKLALHELGIFNEYISIVLIPYIDELSLNEEFTNKDAMLLTDNYSIHLRPETLQMLITH
jgi:hypothetical protein